MIDEISLGAAEAAAKRLEMASSIPILAPTAEVEMLANAILAHSFMPQKGQVDALHVAIAAVARVDYLLTLNRKHIANAHTLPEIYDLVEQLRGRCPLI